MLQRLKKLKQLWDKSAGDMLVIPKSDVPEDILMRIDPDKLEIKGDGKAEFLGQGTEEEFKQLENEDKGIKGIFGL